MHHRSCLPWLILLILLLVAALVIAMTYVPIVAVQSFGPPDPSLSRGQRISFAVSLLWNAEDLTVTRASNTPEQIFVIEQGESVNSISQRLQQIGLIRNAYHFRIYLIWTGLDKSIQAGTYNMKTGQTGIEIAHIIQNPLPKEAVLVVLPGWRMEEVASALPTSGLNISLETFRAATLTPKVTQVFFPAGANAEGFLFPDRYTLPRSTSADQLVSVMLADFAMHLTPDMQTGFARHNLDVYQAVVLASIIQREAQVDEEMPILASVFYNRLGIGMKLESDPTVQYALGYNDSKKTWWTNPLSLANLQVDSPYNTYLYPGLPPAPISNPSLSALQAVAFPAQTTYFFFRARCDGSGLHSFAKTFEEHQQNACR